MSFKTYTQFFVVLFYYAFLIEISVIMKYELFYHLIHIISDNQNLLPEHIILPSVVIVFFLHGYWRCTIFEKKHPLKH